MHVGVVPVFPYLPFLSLVYRFLTGQMVYMVPRKKKAWIRAHEIHNAL